MSVSSQSLRRGGRPRPPSRAKLSSIAATNMLSLRRAGAQNLRRASLAHPDGGVRVHVNIVTSAPAVQIFHRLVNLR
jgi:hypothetical protein